MRVSVDLLNLRGDRIRGREPALMAPSDGSRGVLQAGRNPAEILIFTMTAATSEAARAKLETNGQPRALIPSPTSCAP